MTACSDLAALQEILRERDSWHVWMIEYGITHSLMSLALHDGSFPRHIRLECRGCERFEGRLQGGPYRLELTCSQEANGPIFDLRSADRTLRVTCAHIREVGRTT